MTTTRHRVVVNGVRRRVSRNDQFLRVANIGALPAGRCLLLPAGVVVLDAGLRAARGQRMHDAGVASHAGQRGRLVKQGLFGDAERRRNPALDVDLPRPFLGLGAVGIGTPVGDLDDVDGPQVPVLGDCLAYADRPDARDLQAVGVDALRFFVDPDDVAPAAVDVGLVPQQAFETDRAFLDASRNGPVGPDGLLDPVDEVALPLVVQLLVVPRLERLSCQLLLGDLLGGLPARLLGVGLDQLPALCVALLGGFDRFDDSLRVPREAVVGPRPWADSTPSLRRSRSMQRRARLVRAFRPVLVRAAGVCRDEVAGALVA